MSMLLSAHRSALTALILPALLVGCASKNPLMDDAPATAKAPAKAAPATTVAAAPAKPAETTAVQTAAAPATPAPAPAAPAAQASAPAAAAPAAVVAAAPAASKPSGVQTIEQRRLFGIFSPYRIDIQQGNFISQEMVAQLKQGMTPEQVRFVLGAPLLTDLFHADRWDYVFRLKKGNGEIITSKVVLRFQGNRLASVEGADLPNEKDYISLIAGSAPPEAAKPAAPATPAAASTAATTTGPAADPSSTPAPKDAPNR